MRRAERRVNAEGTRKGLRDSAANPQIVSLLWGFGGSGGTELHGANDAFAFFDEDDLIGGYVFERFHKAARPADFEEFDFFSFADAEVHAQIMLWKRGAAAPHFIALLVGC